MRHLEYVDCVRRESGEDVAGVELDAEVKMEAADILKKEYNLIFNNIISSLAN